MNERLFEYWRKARKHGGLIWIFKNTLTISALFVVFHTLFNYLSSDAVSIFVYLQQEAAIYVVFPSLMFFVNWGIWLYRESKFKEELKRRNVA